MIQRAGRYAVCTAGDGTGQSEEPVDYVRVVDVQIKRESARDGLVLKPAFPVRCARRRREARERGRRHRAVAVRGDEFLQVDVFGRETEALRHHELSLGARHHAQDTVRLPRVAGERFFAENMCAMREGAFDRRRVQCRGQHDVHDVRPHLGQHLLGVRVHRHVGRKVGGQRLSHAAIDLYGACQRRGVAHAHRRHAHAANTLPKGGVDTPHETITDECEGHYVNSLAHDAGRKNVQQCKKYCFIVQRVL